jgi:hypothetical protein
VYLAKFSRFAHSPQKFVQPKHATAKPITSPYYIQPASNLLSTKTWDEGCTAFSDSDSVIEIQRWTPCILLNNPYNLAINTLG